MRVLSWELNAELLPIDILCQKLLWDPKPNHDSTLTLLIGTQEPNAELLPDTLRQKRNIFLDPKRNHTAQVQRPEVFAQIRDGSEAQS